MLLAQNEEETLRAFISFVKRVKPLVFVTYNGDFFDWPYIDKRAAKYGVSLEEVRRARVLRGCFEDSLVASLQRLTMRGVALTYSYALQELGMTYDEVNAEFKGRFSVHLDAFYWVKRDSYLPQGSHGLKAVRGAGAAFALVHRSCMRLIHACSLPRFRPARPQRR